MKQSAPARSPGAFTLIELLIVMAVIGVLAGILLPVFARAREQARRTTCMSNLAQAQKALVIYGNTFSEYFPSHPGWGLSSYDYSLEGQVLRNYAGDHGLSRNLVIGYGAETTNPEEELLPGDLNFIPAGLGMLVARSELPADTLVCPNLNGTVPTFYDSAQYEYTSAFTKVISRSPGKPLVHAEGRQFHQTPTPNGFVAAILSSYAYRNVPFYSRLPPDNAAGGWAYTNDFNLQGAEWTLDFTKPRVKAGYMCPPFKSARQLGNRAILSDAFDYAPTGGGPFAQGFGMYAHKDGYNVVYGDGHAAWFDDEDRLIAKWNDWADEVNPGTDNLTISSMSAQRVWNQFDQFAGIDQN